ncbi:hypothetical protein [Oceanobacillus senegalensis]|uniref:hypothetical protein n=1 Tax=Oceanobacillus senegalensis TaxID=1936063 RepID=UPI000A3110C9|nr:hypothetical protein [Oceanobacillus senegalensis]
MKKLQLVLLVLLLSLLFVSKVSADDGQHNFNAKEIAPRFGTTDTFVDYYNPQVPEGRFVQHSLFWDESQPLDAYFKDQAYNGYSPSGLEISIRFDGYDNYGPANGPYVWGTGPMAEDRMSGDSTEGVYWINEMPYGYIDTTFSDSLQEPGANLGSGWFALINKGNWYYSGTYLDKGLAYQDDFKVRVARTHKHKSGEVAGQCSGEIGDPWCYFQDGPSYEAVESWRGNAPGKADWNYPFVYPEKFDYPYVEPSYRFNG